MVYEIGFATILEFEMIQRGVELPPD